MSVGGTKFPRWRSVKLGPLRTSPHGLKDGTPSPVCPGYGADLTSGLAAIRLLTRAGEQPTTPAISDVAAGDVVDLRGDVLVDGLAGLGALVERRCGETANFANGTVLGDSGPVGGDERLLV